MNDFERRRRIVSGAAFAVIAAAVAFLAVTAFLGWVAGLIVAVAMRPQNAILYLFVTFVAVGIFVAVFSAVRGRLN